MQTETVTEPTRTRELRELVEGSTLVATIMQAPASRDGSGILRGVVVHAIPTETEPHRRPYPVPVAAVSGRFMDGVQLVAHALLARITGEYPGTDTMDEHALVRDGVSILPTVHVQRQRDVTDAVEHAGRAIRELHAETIRAHARDYADGVAVLYGGDLADPDTVAGELRAQASELDSFRAQVDRDPTDDERDTWHDELVRIAERIDETGEVAP